MKLFVICISNKAECFDKDQSQKFYQISYILSDLCNAIKNVAQNFVS